MPIPADSQSKLVFLGLGLAANRRLVCIYQIYRMNSRSGFAMMTAPQISSAYSYSYYIAVCCGISGRNDARQRCVTHADCSLCDS